MGRSISTYTLIGVVLKAVGLLTVVYYTSILSKEQYGTFDLVLSAIVVAMVFVSFEVHQGLMRFIAEGDGRLLATALALSSFGALVFFAFGATLGSFAGWLRLSHGEYQLVLVILFQASALKVFTVYARAKMRTARYAVLVVVQPVVALMLVVVLVPASDASLGMLLPCMIGSYGIAMVVGSFMFRKDLLVLPSIRTARKLVSFSLPLVPSSLAVLALPFIDRTMLASFGSLSDVADFGVAQRVASVSAVVTMGVQAIISPLVYQNLTDPNFPSKLRDMLSKYLLFASAAMVLGMLLAQPAVRLIGGDEYRAIDQVVPMLVFVQLASSIYLFLPGLSVARKTTIIAGINLLALGFNVVVNFFLIEQFGVFGAALGTMLSAFLIVTAYCYFSPKYFGKTLAPGPGAIFGMTGILAIFL